MLEFQPFQLEHKQTIDAYTKPHHFQCSEFTFTNMIIWGQDNKFLWAEQDDCLFVRLKFGEHPPFMFPPIPKHDGVDYQHAMEIALSYFHHYGYTPYFRSLSGKFVELFRRHFPQFTLVPERNSYDYVYLAEDLITLSGRKFHAKRNHIHQFTSQYENYEYRPLTPDMTEACMELYLSWLQEKDIMEPGIIGEMKAIRFLLPHMDALEVRGGSVFVGDKMVAFTIGEQISPNTALIHIEKADASYIGLYAFINQQFAMHNWEHVTYINREEDMGVPGMRKAKLSYRPAYLIEKFEAILRP